jgi:hypothetical protein
MRSAGTSDFRRSGSRTILTFSSTAEGEPLAQRSRVGSARSASFDTLLVALVLLVCLCLVGVVAVHRLYLLADDDEGSDSVSAGALQQRLQSQTAAAATSALSPAAAPAALPLRRAVTGAH